MDCLDLFRDSPNSVAIIQGIQRSIWQEKVRHGAGCTHVLQSTFAQGFIKDLTPEYPKETRRFLPMPSRNVENVNNLLTWRQWQRSRSQIRARRRDSGNRGRRRGSRHIVQGEAWASLLTYWRSRGLENILDIANIFIQLV